MVKNCSNCEHHTWGDEWWNCKTECNQCRYTNRQGEKVPSNWKPLPTTNADRIRAMSDEELAVFLEQTQADVAFNNKSKYAFEWEKWLQQPAEDL